jgi:hypothetical protein
MAPISWPDGKRFAFTIFDDPDAQTDADSRLIYGLLADLGFRTTKGIWPIEGSAERNSAGDTLENPAFRAHCQELQSVGFEIGFHNAAPASVTREETRAALDRFKDCFGHDPHSMANHYNVDAIYWGPARFDPPWRWAYQILTGGLKSNKHFGHVEGHPAFWGDLCRERIRSCRNFVFQEIDTLAMCPRMPYYDPHRPFVNEWYASTEGADWDLYEKALSEANQDHLAASGSACIMYTHFGRGFVRGDGSLQPRFVEQMTRLSKLGGWFVPVAELLDYLRPAGGPHVLTSHERGSLEQRWMAQKLLRGTS